MQTIKIDINKITEEQIGLIVDYLKGGKVIAYPTDTIYGLGCDARDARAVERIKKIKGGREEKSFIVLISDFKMLRKYCFINLEQTEYLKKVWGETDQDPILFKGITLKSPQPPLLKGAKTPVTVILKRRPILPAVLTGGLNSLAVRLPSNQFLTEIISKAGFPIVSTSLNKKGEKPLTNVIAIGEHFKYKPDLIIDAGECKITKPSRLVDLRDIKNIKVLRK